MIATLFAFALAASQAPAPADGVCALARPEACSDTRDLADDPAFAVELKRFVGERTTHFLDVGGRAYPETLAVLTGPTAPMQKIGDLYLFTGCRDKACEEQGAALLNATGQFVAVAVLHTDCGRFAPSKTCFERDILSVIIPEDGQDQTVVDALTAWARRQVEANLASPGAPATRLEQVEVIGAARPRAPTVAKAYRLPPQPKAEVAAAQPEPEPQPPPVEAPRAVAVAKPPTAKPQPPKAEALAAAAPAPEPQTPHTAATAIAKDALVKLAQADPAPPPPPASAIIELPSAPTPDKPAPKPKPKPKTWVWHWTPYGY